MGNEVALHIVGGQLYAVLKAVECREDGCCNTLGGLSLIIARKHPVDIRVVRRPEPFS